ncbi:MAG: twin-arginine translocase TatA/TatE family subunit [Solirubrobacteraceae bacterium]
MGLDNPIHIPLLLLVVLLVFGAKRLPEIGRSLGDGKRGFKETLHGTHPATSLDHPGVTPMPAPMPAPVSTIHPAATETSDAAA